MILVFLELLYLKLSLTCKSTTMQYVTATVLQFQFRLLTVVLYHSIMNALPMYVGEYTLITLIHTNYHLIFPKDFTG